MRRVSVYSSRGVLVGTLNVGNSTLKVSFPVPDPKGGFGEWVLPIEKGNKVILPKELDGIGLANENAGMQMIYSIEGIT